MRRVSVESRACISSTSKRLHTAMYVSEGLLTSRASPQRATSTAVSAHRKGRQGKSVSVQSSQARAYACVQRERRL
jgi:hypothetical protein